MTTTRILLTGASGAMGQLITRAMVEAGHQVRGTVRDARRARVGRQTRHVQPQFDAMSVL